MRHTALVLVCRTSAFFWLLALGSGLSPAADLSPEEIVSLADPGLKAVVIDSDESESFLGLQLDSAGRLFAGSREALFVYEPAPGGLYQPRKLLCRFPKDAWVYDIAIRGDDLYVSTHTAIYLIEGGVKKREGLSPKRLVWGLPMMQGWDMHQGIHDLAIGPEGDIYFSNGDEIVNYTDWKRPDHWAHWTYFHGKKSDQVTGNGGIYRISPDGERFDVIAVGTRNSCGIAFDRGWNLFTTDNDHESRPEDYVPGRLLHVTPGAYFSWPRGWMPEKKPWRADLLDTMHPNVGRYVPTGMIYYDDPFLPESCRHSLYVAEWGRGELRRYPLREEGASFKVDEVRFLAGAPNVRPVGIAVGRGGRIFTSVCHMKGNEASPVYRSEIVMITRADDKEDAPCDSYEETAAPMEKLFAELENPSWQRRYRAHVELLRRGETACREAAVRLDNAAPGSALQIHLLWLAAAGGEVEKVKLLSEVGRAEVRCQALRALDHFAPEIDNAVFDRSLKDANPQAVQASLVAMSHRGGGLSLNRILEMARGTDCLLRQTSVQILAARFSVGEIQRLCESPDVDDRLTGILIAGQRLTVPPFIGPLPADWPLEPMHSKVAYAGESVEFTTGNFTMADVWAKHAKSADEEHLLAVLARRLNDSEPDNAREAAFFLHLLKDPQTESQCVAILGISTGAAAQAVPLKGAVSTGNTEMPAQFKTQDWAKEAAQGDRQKGAALFISHGCSTCHAVKAGDVGGGGPSLAGAGSRFSVAYLVESVITPNKTVSPIFRWTMVSKKDGSSIAGLVTSETAGEIELLLPAGIRQTIRKEEIAKRELQDRSPMPEGLIQAPEELRDLLAYLISLKENK